MFTEENTYVVITKFLICIANLHCYSQNRDINFEFAGFGVVGRVLASGTQ